MRKNRRVKKVSLKEEENLAGCCGLYCGLCPRFQSKSPSRCPGCKLLNEERVFCGVFGCCVRKKEMITCADCDEYPCEKLLKKLGIDLQLDSFISHKPALPNLDRNREVGLKVWLKEQRERRLVLEGMLANYNDGRSMSFYCVATALMPISMIKKAVDKMQNMLVKNQVDDSDIKAKAKALRSIIQDIASKSGIDLKLRKQSRKKEN